MSMRVRTLPADGLGGTTQFNGFSPQKWHQNLSRKSQEIFPSSVEGGRKSNHCELF